MQTFHPKSCILYEHASSGKCEIVFLQNVICQVKSCVLKRGDLVANTLVYLLKVRIHFVHLYNGAILGALR